MKHACHGKKDMHCTLAPVGTSRRVFSFTPTLGVTMPSRTWCLRRRLSGDILLLLLLALKRPREVDHLMPWICISGSHDRGPSIYLGLLAQVRDGYFDHSVTYINLGEASRAQGRPVEFCGDEVAKARSFNCRALGCNGL